MRLQDQCDECAATIWLEDDEQPLCVDHLNEERPGTSRQEDHQAAHTNSQRKEAVMNQSTTHSSGLLKVTPTKYGDMVSHEPANEAINTLLQAATGLGLYELQWYLRNSISLSSEEAWDRLGRGHEWTIRDIVKLAALWEIKASTLIKAVSALGDGADANEVVEQFGLDRRPYITSEGEVEEEAS